MRHDLVVSVISPNYYGTNEYVSELYASLLAQEYPYWEWVVCNNNGGVLPGYILTDPRVKAFALGESEQNVSRLKQKCAEYSTGDIIAIVDADDTLCPHSLRKVVEVYTYAPWVEAVIGCETFDIERGCEKRHEPTSRYFFERMPHVWHGGSLTPVLTWTGWNCGFSYLYHPTHLITMRRRVFMAIGGYNVSMHTPDDFALCMRAHQHGVREYIVRDILYHVRWHKQKELHSNMPQVWLELAELFALGMRNYPPPREKGCHLWLPG